MVFSKIGIDSARAAKTRCVETCQRYRPKTGLNTMHGPHFVFGSPQMVDPLAEVVSLLRPSAPFAKVATAAGPWLARRAEAGRPFFCAIVAGVACLTVHGHEPLVLELGD